MGGSIRLTFAGPLRRTVPAIFKTASKNRNEIEQEVREETEVQRLVFEIQACSLTPFERIEGGLDRLPKQIAETRCPKERRTPIRRGPWFADSKRFTSSHRHFMGFGGSESAAPCFGYASPVHEESPKGILANGLSLIHSPFPQLPPVDPFPSNILTIHLSFTGPIVPPSMNSAGVRD